MFPADIYTTPITSNGYAGVNVNQMSYRWNALISKTIAGTTYQVITYWSTGRYLVIGWRVIGGSWTLYTYNGAGGLPSIQVTGDDNHDVATVGIDQDGYIHATYGMHIDPLRYRKSIAPLGSWTGGLTANLTMLNTTAEDQVTYPTFVHDPVGKLYFLYRGYGGSGNSNLYFYSYDEVTTTWTGAAGTAGTTGRLIEGRATIDSPYLYRPAFDDNFGSGGYLHIFWHWRDDGVNTNSNFKVSHVRWNGTTFTQQNGAAQTIPITPSNCEAVDPVSSGNYLTSLNSSDVDGQGRPHAAYMKRGLDGCKHIYHAYHTGAAWVVHQVTTTQVTPVDDIGPHLLTPPAIAIDRTTDTVYIIYRDEYDIASGILIATSSGDYSSWNRNLVYPVSTGAWYPKYDPIRWLEAGVFSIPIEYWATGQSALPIRILEWSPGGNTLVNTVREESITLGTVLNGVRQEVLSGTIVNGVRQEVP